MRIFPGLFGLAIACIFAGQAFAACGPNSLGTSRTIKLDASKHRYFVGRERALGLRKKEVILTFDDGPLAGSTSRILKVLKKECVKATFFYVGRMARSHPRLVRRVVAEGHTLAHHTYSHNRLPAYSKRRASQLIDKGISTIQKIAYGEVSSTPRVPFFRYPYLARNKATDRILARKGLIVFDANIDSLDWKTDSADKVHNRIMRRLRQQGRGIILMHDIQNRTAKMLPRLLRSLKKEGYRVVHMVPKGRAVPAADPVVVASLNPSKAAPAQSYEQPELDDFPSEAKMASAVRDANAELGTPPPIVPAAIEPSENEPTLREKSERAGVEVVIRSVGTPDAVALASERQLTPVERAETPQKRTRIKRSKRPVKKRARKTKSFTVRPRSKKRSRKFASAAKKWKLRRSQWILR